MHIKDLEFGAILKVRQSAPSCLSKRWWELASWQEPGSPEPHYLLLALPTASEGQWLVQIRTSEAVCEVPQFKFIWKQTNMQAAWAGELEYLNMRSISL